MKRIRKTLALVIVLCMALSVSAFAADVTWKDYQDYLIEAAGGNAPDLDEFKGQVEAIGSWDEMPLDQSPWDQFFTTLGLSTWDEFVAAGGVGRQSAMSGSMGGASGETASEPSGEAPSGEASGAPSGEASEAPAASSAIPATAETKSTADMTPSDYQYLTNYTNRKSTGDQFGYIYVEHDETGSAEIALDETVTGDGFTAVYAHGADADVTVTGRLVLTDDSAGENASDFSGQGSATVAYDGAKLLLKDLTYYSEGFERGVTVVSQDATVTIEDSDITVMGADALHDAWEGYHSSADQNYMISPPWCLGLYGGGRILNMIGATPKLIIKDSVLTGGQAWGLLSTDSGSNMTIVVVDSELTSLPESEGGSDSGWRIFGYDEDAYGSAYGSYYIGNPVQYYYGATFNGVTYAAIITGAEAGHYASSNGTIEMVDASGELLGTVEGKGRPTVINGVFGFMQHNSISDAIYVEDGTIINAADAIVIHKAAKGSWVFDNAELNSEKGVLFQMIDNDDDARIGGSPMAVDPGFDETYSDSKLASHGVGFPGVNYAADTATGGYDVDVTYKNGEYVGDIYNGTGYYGKAGDNLTVTLGENAVLQGDIALTSTVKAVPYSAEAIEGIAYYGDDIQYVLLDAEGNETDAANAAYIQITDYTINEYFLQGHVENMLHYNGASTISVTVAAGAEWDVADESLVTSLVIEDGATVRGEITENADGSVTITAGDSVIPAGAYGGTVEVFGGADVAGGGVTADGVLDVGAAMDTNGAAQQPSGEASGAPSAEPAAAAGGESLEDAYIEYIHEWLLAELEVNSQMTIEQIEDEFMPLVEAGDYVSFPAEMLYSGMLEQGAAMTFEEFAAQY